MPFAKTAVRWLQEKAPSRDELKRKWRSEHFMFGRPEWFRLRTKGWGLRPASWQGYTYTATWITAMVAPFLGLALSAHRAPEGLVWLAASLGAFLWDVNSIVRAKVRQTTFTPPREVVYIGEDGMTRLK